VSKPINNTISIDPSHGANLMNQARHCYQVPLR